MTTGNLTCTTLTVSGVVTTGALTASGLLTANAGVSIPTGFNLTGAGTAAITGFASVSAGTGTFTSGLTLTGATITGTPTWSSSQAITLSTAAQPNITSVGTLTSLTAGAISGTTGALSSTSLKLGTADSGDITLQIGPDAPGINRSSRIAFLNTPASSGLKNWFISHNWNTPGGIGFAPSTTNGGTMIGSDVVSIVPAGLSVTGTLGVTGAVTTNGGLQTFGANDSAGAGYRTVRVPNI